MQSFDNMAVTIRIVEIKAEMLNAWDPGHGLLLGFMV
jgi:hypothetical protein